MRAVGARFARPAQPGTCSLVRRGRKPGSSSLYLTVRIGAPDFFTASFYRSLAREESAAGVAAWRAANSLRPEN